MGGIGRRTQSPAGPAAFTVPPGPGAPIHFALVGWGRKDPSMAAARRERSQVLGLLSGGIDVDTAELHLHCRLRRGNRWWRGGGT